MSGINRWRSVAKTLLISGLLACCINLWGCGDSPRSTDSDRSASQPSSKAAPVKLAGKISEVSPPEVIQELRTVLEKYQPQVTIVSPSPNQVLQDDALSVRLRVKDFPLFKDQKLELGPHLHLFLDNQPYQAVYDVSQPIALKDLAPGTHTLRAFASRPWHESFKNEGAYAQTTFHVFTKTPNNNPSPDQPLLTYSRPQGGYGAEPIMLDFFLTNAPLHLVAQEDDKDDVADWRIKVTVNGSEFVLDRWQPLYLKGFTPGKNWVQLDYIDEKGNSIQNVYNNTARSFTYTPNGNDTLSKLVRDELSFAQARSIVDPDYKAETPESSPEPAPVVKPSAGVEPPIVEPAPQAENDPIEKSESLKSEEPKPLEEPKGGFFNRFRRPEPLKAPSVITPGLAPSAPPEIVEPIAEPVPEVPEMPVPEVPVPQKTEAPKSRFYDRFRRPSETLKASPEPAPSIAPAPIEPKEVEPSLTEKIPEATVPKAEPKSNFYDRFRRPIETPKPAPSQAPAPVKEVETLPEAETTPPGSDGPSLKTALERRLGIPLGSSGKTTVKPSPEAIVTSESEQSEPSEVFKIKPVEPIQPKRPDQFRRPSRSIESPEAPIKLPETLEAPAEESTPIKAVE